MPKSELAKRTAVMIPEFFSVTENATIAAVQSLQWFKRAPTNKQFLRVRLEIFAFSFHYLDYLVFNRYGPKTRDLFIEDLAFLTMERLTDGEENTEADEFRRSFVRILNVNAALYSQYDRKVADIGESPDGTALWWFAIYLTQTIEGNALNLRHVRKIYEVGLFLVRSLDELLARSFAGPMERT